MATNDLIGTCTSIVCNLNVFNAEQRERYQVLVALLENSVVSVGELPDGLAVNLASDADVCLALMEFITLERRCCPFLTFHLELAPQDGPLTLSLTGPDGVKDVLEAFAARFARTDA